MAELIENAVMFTPAGSRIRVTGRRGLDHYVITIADHGPGMSQEDLQSAAEVIGDSTPPATDAWWGFHTAGRLAERHGIAIRLRNGDEGGLMAGVYLPATLLIEGARQSADPNPDTTLVMVTADE